MSSVLIDSTEFITAIFTVGVRMFAPLESVLLWVECDALFLTSPPVSLISNALCSVFVFTGTRNYYRILIFFSIWTRTLFCLFDCFNIKEVK